MFKKVILGLALATALVAVGTSASASTEPVQEETSMQSSNSVSWWWE
jgi:ABC-type glycerol-3-phosphate transport system substrate-binding protein